MPEKDILDVLARIAEGVEKLAEDPVIQIEAGPPVCPHCEKMNPKVQVGEKQASGPLGEFVIECRCLRCSKVFYAIPTTWDCLPTVRAAEEAMKERRATSGY